MKNPTMFIFSGLPGSGKSTLAQELSRLLNATYVRIDTFEQGLRDICNYDVQAGEGYALSHLLASDNLKLGNHVVADSVNPWDITRIEWNQLAISNHARFVNIEVICTDEIEHKRRVETRKLDIKNLKPVSWNAVQTRDYHSWNIHRIVIDTFGRNVSESRAELLDELKSFLD